MFKHYREKTGVMMLLAYALIAALLCWRYRPAQAWRVMLAPALAAWFTLGLLGYAGADINLFHVLALLLVLAVIVERYFLTIGSYFINGYNIVIFWLARIKRNSSHSLLRYCGEYRHGVRVTVFTVGAARQAQPFLIPLVRHFYLAILKTGCR